MSHHRNLVVNFGGGSTDFEITDNVQMCSVAAANVEPSPLFDNLSDDCKPVACKSRRYSEEDQNFIRNETR